MSGLQYLLRELSAKNELIARLVDENVKLDDTAKELAAELDQASVRSQKVESLLTDAQRRKLDE